VHLIKSSAACVFVLLVSSVVVGDLRAASPRERIREKQAQAQAVLVQVNQLDRRFEASVEAWNGARYQLASTRRELAADRAALRVAERQRRIAVARVRARLVALYESDDQPTTIAILFGSTDVSDVLARLDAAHAIADADRRLAAQTAAARDRYARAARRTAAVERQRAASVSQLAAQRSQIGSLLGERKRLLASVQSEVSHLQAEEARRQAILAAEARARLARAQAEARREAQQRREAAAAAARAAAAKPTPPTTTEAAPTPAPATTVAPAPTTTVEIPSAPASPVLPVQTLGGGHPEAASIAMQYLGVPYVWGGASRAGMDCSGLVMVVYAQLGISLPHFAAAQYGFGTPVARDQLQPGDLVFFDGLDHVGIYAGGGQVIHAPHTGDVVKISSLSEFGNGYVGARRL
jgi:cell wall-associated NlpC family hydrolase